MPAGDDGAMEVPGDHADDLRVTAHHFGQALYPGCMQTLGHPAVAALDWRVMEDKHGRPIVFQQRFIQPRGLFGGKRAAVVAFLQRVEHHEAQRAVHEGILHMAGAAHRHIGKDAAEIGPEIMIAQREMHRKWQTFGDAFQGLIRRDAAAFAEIAGGQQQIGLRGERQQRFHHLVETLAVHFRRIIRLETKVDIGHLGNQHLAPLCVDSQRAGCPPDGRCLTRYGTKAATDATMRRW